MTAPGPSRAERIAQKLSGRAEAILGYQELLIDDVRRNGPADALEDLEKVRDAAQRLNRKIRDIRESEIATDGRDAAKMRHDLRTPINAILGYSEMIAEDFSDELDPAAQTDLEKVMSEARALSQQVDTAMNPADDDADTQDHATEQLDAQRLRQALTDTASRELSETGHILVIDDEAANREILSRQLERKGHSVKTAGSAHAAFDALQVEAFDMVLLDILMPDMNGIEMLARLKSDDRWREMPVVMVSGLRETEAVAKCVLAGAEDYLPKPIDPVLLHARVNACLDKLRWREKEKDFNKRIRHEKDRADALLHAMLPAPVIERLNDGESQIADRFDSATILFADIVDFTPMVARLDPGLLLRELARLFSAFDDLATKHGIEKIKTIGDAYMAAAGIPLRRTDHPEAVVAFARDMLRIMPDVHDLGPQLNIRIGVHTGPVIAGLIGKKRSVYDVWGETVNLASRLESTGAAGRIQVSAATLAALGAAGELAEPRTHVVKGVGEITSFFII